MRLSEEEEDEEEEEEEEEEGIQDVSPITFSPSTISPYYLLPRRHAVSPKSISSPGMPYFLANSLNCSYVFRYGGFLSSMVSSRLPGGGMTMSCRRTLGGRVLRQWRHITVITPIDLTSAGCGPGTGVCFVMLSRAKNRRVPSGQLSFVADQ